MRTLLAALAVLACAPATRAGATLPPLDPAPCAFVDVHVVSMDVPGVLRHQTVLVKDGRITAVGPKDEVSVPEGTRRIDGAGRFLVPGLCDMHVHVPPGDGAAAASATRALTLLLAHGVTTARGLAGHPSHPALRDRIAAGDQLGPTLYVAGPALHDGNVHSAADARAAVAAQAEAGFDLVKSHHVTDPAIWRAIQETAAERELPVAGHVADTIGLARALEHGQQVEHLDGFLRALLADEAAPTFGQFPPLPVLAQIDVDGLPALAQTIAERGAAQTPTLALFAAVVSRTPVEDLRARPEMRYVPAATRQAWAIQHQGMMDHFPAAYAEAFLPLRAAIVRALHRADAPLLAGSDTPQAFLPTGIGLHAELRALVAAGLSPWHALEAATATPARYLASTPRQGSARGHAADFGTVVPGRRADLVLLGRDPTAEVDHAREIEGVLLRGRWFDRAALDRLLEDVAESAAG